MNLCASCIRCLVDRQEERVHAIPDEEKKSLFMKAVAGVIAGSGEGDSGPVLVERINRAYVEWIGPLTDYDDIKKDYNTLLLSMEDSIFEKIQTAPDPIYAAFAYAQAANYIDFGITGHVDKSVLYKLLDKALEDSLDHKVYEEFIRDLSGAHSLTYITDNCGEVVLDKLAVREISRAYPKLSITVMVRGAQALNDATMEDALQTGMCGAATVISNGCGVAGTPISCLSEEAGDCLRASDVILAKGQGNFETMHGSGLNIYYSFLCKCEWFQKRFGMEKNRGMFVRERSLLEEAGKGEVPV